MEVDLPVAIAALVGAGGLTGLLTQLPKVIRSLGGNQTITVTNTGGAGGTASAEADGTGRHSIAPVTAPAAVSSFAGIDGETTPERVTAVRCEELRGHLESKLEARSDKGMARLEGKMDGMVAEQRRMNDTLVRLTTLSEEAGKRDDRYSKRLERLERERRPSTSNA
jgi:hypothetical protein